MSKSCEQAVNLTKETIYFTWKIKNFLSVGLIADIESPPIKCSETELRLRLRPQWKFSDSDTEGVKVTVSEISSSKQEFKCRIGVVNKDGEWFVSHAGTKKRFNAETLPTFNIFSKDIVEIFVSKRVLEEKAAELLPNDVLTVFFKLNVMLVLPDDVTEAASTSGTKTLATDMKGLFEDPRHSDVTIRVGKEEFSAHKAILACRSKVFRAMFESGMKECQENTLDLVGMEHSTARSMLEYIYTGSLGKLSMEEAFDLYVAADRYNLQDIKDGCKECILKDMSADQACEVAAFANLHSDEVLLMASCLALKNNFQQVLRTENWRNFSKQNPDLYSELIEKIALM